MDNGIKWAQEAGLKVLVDLHKTLGYMFDTNAVPNPDAFFQEEKLQDTFVKIWEKLSARYKDKSDDVAYELLNEVMNPNYEDVWNKIATRAFNAIRKIAPDSWIVVGGVNYNSVSAVPGIKVPYDNKTVYTFHCYEPLVFTHQKAYWVKDMPADYEVAYPGPSIEYIREKSRPIPQARYGAIFDPSMDKLQLDENFFINLFKPAIETAQKLGVALYCGEYGVIDQAPAQDTARWFKDIHKALEKYQIASAIWSYKEMDFGLIGSHYDSVRKDIIS
ncbi:MAG: glycoside hydrolase family 5 protein [Treponema sp.]|nr:glycoside hydrolase family 5 protein [Treponema sp.]